MKLPILLSFLLVITLSEAANTTSTSIADELRPCYNHTYMVNPMTIAPATLNFFLDVLRAVEDANVGQRDGTYLSSDIIRKFRQDGIAYTASAVGIPFSAKNNEKNKALQRLTMDATTSVDTSKLSIKEKCTLHYLISTTSNGTVRGDESTTCRQSSRYTSRWRRDSNVELMLTAEEISSCPTQSGVVLTPWGAVSFGSVMAGIAAGFKPQSTVLGQSIYSNTLSGDLAYSMLKNKLVPSIGSSEGWDNSMSPKILYNQPASGSITEFTLTNSIIRGSLDGFYLAKSIPEIKHKYSDVKISQLLDWYYSPRGLLNNTIAACNRQKLETSFTTTEMLTNETRKLMETLNPMAIGAGSLTPEEYQEKSAEVVDSFNSYLTKLSDVACNTDDLPVQRKVVDLLIYIDTKWSYKTLESVIAYILNNVDINKYEGNYTLINGNNGEIIVPSTHRLSHFYEFFNESQSTSSNSFDWSSSIKSVEEQISEKYNNKTLGGKSVVALFIPRTTPSASDKTIISQRYSVIKNKCPDLQLFVLGTGAESDYSGILQNTAKQFSTLTDLESSSVESVKSYTKKVVDFIKDTPRSIINKDCGSSTYTYTDNVETQGLAYYKVNPYFYFNGGSDKKLKIKETSGGALWVCMKPGVKPTNTTATCVKLANNETSYDLSYCSSYDSCESLFISVEGITSKNYCKDCRFPDSIMFQITLENVACGSSATKIIANLFVLALVLVALKLNN